MKDSSESDLCFRVDVVDECVFEVQRRRLVNCDEMENIEKCLQVQEDPYEDDPEHQTFSSQIQLPNTDPTPPSTIKPPNIDLKALPQHLRYTFLGEKQTLPVIISSKLTQD